MIPSKCDTTIVLTIAKSSNRGISKVGIKKYNLSYCSVSSNQSTIRWFEIAGAPHWQCSSAPSSVVNKMYFFGQVRASYTFLGCPGNESSFSASRTKVGHFIFCAISLTEYF